jgi:transposase
MSNVTGITRGDRRRNERRARLRELVPTTSAVVGIDLGEDTQMLVVADHDSRVLARKVINAKASGLGPGLGWAVDHAAAAGFASVTVACEPTGSRWMHLQDLTAQRGVSFVCVQPLASHRAREEEDYTRDKSDYKDAVLIARLAGELRCYAPESCEGDWATLRHLGRRRAELITRGSRAVLQLRDLLALAWPVVLQAAAQPLVSTTWQAALAVVLGRCDGDPSRLRRLGIARFTDAVRRELPRWGGVKIRRRIIEAVYGALSDTTGAVTRQRRGALQRAGWVIEDLRSARAGERAVEAQMLTVLDALGATAALASIPGLSLEAAAQILAEAGDPTRFTSSRSLVKHAGLNPSENTSATFRGKTRTSKRGRPGLRLAAWRAAWAVIRHNPVLAARHQHLTSRQHNRLTPGQAHVACAAALLRWIHAVTTTGRAWDPRIAAGDRNHTAMPGAA